MKYVRDVRTGELFMVFGQNDTHWFVTNCLRIHTYNACSRLGYTIQKDKCVEYIRSEE
jgi:hypothetical protein